jgi:hypothetical protein
MDRTIARLNIEHYKRLLERETDGAKRQTIMLLLAEEEAKLPANPDGKTPAFSGGGRPD